MRRPLADVAEKSILSHDFPHDMSHDPSPQNSYPHLMTSPYAQFFKHEYHDRSYDMAAIQRSHGYHTPTNQSQQFHIKQEPRDIGYENGR